MAYKLVAKTSVSVLSKIKKNCYDTESENVRCIILLFPYRLLTV